MLPVFTANADIWNGGYYELAIELVPESDDRLDTAIKTLWTSPDLDGCYLRSDVEPEAQERVVPSRTTQEITGHLLGVATLPGERRVACGTFVLREGNDGSDWLGFYLPMGALACVYDVGAFPFDDGRSSLAWRGELDTWLVEIARRVYQVVPFPLALIGWDMTAETSAARIAAEGLPAKRWDGYLLQEGADLCWYPPSLYNALITFSD